MIVLGIVGPPAGGKSTVARRLAEHGATWIDADQVAREVIERPEVRTELIGHFGVEIADESGRIDRARLASRVFGDDDVHRAALTYLEGVVHPPTRCEVHRRLRQAAERAAGKLPITAGEDPGDTGGAAASTASPVVILDVALLFESGWDVCCDSIWCVDAPWSVRLQRAAARGWDEAELRRREARQLSSAEKRRRSNHTLINDTQLSDLYAEVDSRYRVLAGSRTPAADAGHCLSDLAAEPVEPH